MKDVGIWEERRGTSRDGSRHLRRRERTSSALCWGSSRVYEGRRDLGGARNERRFPPSPQPRRPQSGLPHRIHLSSRTEESSSSAQGAHSNACKSNEESTVALRLASSHEENERETTDRAKNGLYRGAPHRLAAFHRTSYPRSHIVCRFSSRRRRSRSSESRAPSSSDCRRCLLGRSTSKARCCVVTYGSESVAGVPDPR